MKANHPTHPVSLKHLARLFLKLGIVGFGGPAAHIALMRQEVVVKRSWLTEQEFLDLLGATNLIPGPNSTELAIHIGREKGGWRGLLVAGLCFILPAVIITGTLAAVYAQYGTLPQVAPFFYGIKPAVIAVIIMAIVPLAKASFKNITLYFMGIAALILAVSDVPEFYIMFGAGLLGLTIAAIKRGGQTVKSFFPLALLQMSGSESSQLLSTLFFTFLKIGAILYGSGYVLFAYIDAELVTSGLITRQQLTDAIAVGQFTPGPVFSSVTFVGYQAGGLAGALVSTIAIFLPSFLFVALLNPLVAYLRRSPLFSNFIDAVNVASIALIIAVCVDLGRSAIADWRTALIAMVSFAVLWFFKNLNSAWIIGGGAAAGYLLLLI